MRGGKFVTLFSVVQRTLDLAGVELVTNGLFTSDLSGWADLSSAGGAIAWNSGHLKATNTTGGARADQSIAASAGARYAFMVQNVGATVAGSILVGSAIGSSDYLNKNTNPALAAQVGMAEFTTTGTTIGVRLAEFSVGSSNWDNVTLRKLTAASFPVGKVFVDDFSLKSDGPLGITTQDGLPWRFIDPGTNVHVIPLISSGKMTMAASGQTTSAGYPYLNLGNGKATGVHCDLAWTGTSAAVAMISVTPTGSRPLVSDITTNALHVPFSDTQVNIQTYVGGVLTTETIVYGVACATDGTVYPNVGWTLNGSTLTVSLPDGSTVVRTGSKFALVAGSCAIIEQFYGVAGTVAVGRVAVRLG